MQLFIQLTFFAAASLSVSAANVEFVFGFAARGRAWAEFVLDATGIGATGVLRVTTMVVERKRKLRSESSWQINYSKTDVC
jgi:hypothetical protein